MMETYIIERLKTIHTIVVMSLSGLLPTYLSRLVSHIISISLQIQVPCLLSGNEHRTLIDQNVQGPPGTPYYRGLPIGLLHAPGRPQLLVSPKLPSIWGVQGLYRPWNGAPTNVSLQLPLVCAPPLPGCPTL